MTVEFCLFQVIRYTLGAKAYVFKGEILGDNRPPTVGTKLDGVLYLPHPLIPPLLRRRGTGIGCKGA